MRPDAPCAGTGLAYLHRTLPRRQTALKRNLKLALTVLGACALRKRVLGREDGKALPAGLEPATLRLTASRSNQLSYGSYGLSTISKQTVAATLDLQSRQRCC